jgi:hypothetical protein
MARDDASRTRARDDDASASAARRGRAFARDEGVDPRRTGVAQSRARAMGVNGTRPDKFT